jgi:four helix bundle protein
MNRFEDLVVWRRARELTREVYGVTREGGFARDFALRDQMRRAAVSVLSNIAEGFERGGDVELNRFLLIAKGSCGELRGQLYVALDQAYVDAATFERLQDHSLAVSGMLQRLGERIRQRVASGGKR